MPSPITAAAHPKTTRSITAGFTPNYSTIPFLFVAIPVSVLDAPFAEPASFRDMQVHCCKLARESFSGTVQQSEQSLARDWKTTRSRVRRFFESQVASGFLRLLHPARGQQPAAYVVASMTGPLETAPEPAPVVVSTPPPIAKSAQHEKKKERTKERKALVLREKQKTETPSSAPPKTENAVDDSVTVKPAVDAYRERVLELFRKLPRTRHRSGRGDARTATDFEKRGIPVEMVEAGMLLAVARLMGNPKLSPVAHLKYFEQSIQEARSDGTYMRAGCNGWTYTDYLRWKVLGVKPAGEPR